MMLPSPRLVPQTSVFATVAADIEISLTYRQIDAGRISAATMAEPPIAGLVAYLAWNEIPTILAMVGYLVIVGSVLVLVLDHTAEQKEPRLSSASDLDGREKPQPSTTLSDV